MSALALVLGIALVCVGGWVYGELTNNRAIRLTSSIFALVVFTMIAITASGIHTALSIGVPTSTAVHEYLDAAAEQLAAGHTDFVVKEFSSFKERAHVTYETGAFVDAVNRETARMKRGPQANQTSDYDTGRSKVVMAIGEQRDAPPPRFGVEPTGRSLVAAR